MEIRFLIRTLAVTLLIVAFMQVRMGQKSLEEHTATFIRTSWLMLPLQSVADAGVKGIKLGTKWATDKFHQRAAKHFGKKSKDGPPVASEAGASGAGEDGDDAAEAKKPASRFRWTFGRIQFAKDKAAEESSER
jgi:hypothetical protein